MAMKMPRESALTQISGQGVRVPFDPSLVRFFAGVTGHSVAVFSAPPFGVDWDAQQLIASCSSESVRRRSSRVGSRCLLCAERNLRRALERPNSGHGFRGHCGRSRYLLPVARGSRIKWLLLLRANSRSNRGPGAARSSTRDGGDRRSILLLRMLARMVEWREEAEARASEVVRLSELVASHERELASLHGRISRGVPAPARETPALAFTAARSHEVVRSMVERLRNDPSRCFSLAQIAKEFGMNASYLSTVFAHEAGMPFRSYLTALRLQRAKTLLADPHLSISEIASQVGYGAVSRFRIAFRTWTGMAPAHWRMVMHGSIEE